MPSTFFGLNIGTSGLYTYQAALNTTAHNIANTETEGYTRQLINQRATDAIKVNNTYGMAGTGVEVTGIIQARNEYYDLKFWKNQTIYGEYSTKEHYMTEVENYFNEINVEGFTTSFNSLHDSLQELAKDPSSIPVRTQVTNYSESLAEYFNFLSTSLVSIQEESNFEIKNQVDHINSLGKQIATLTKQINTLEVNGGVANDLRDQRALLVDDLSEIVNVSVSENSVGDGVGINSYVVKIDRQTLVDTNHYNTLVAVPRKAKDEVDQNNVEGLYDIEWSNKQTFNTESSTLGGTLQALFAVRDGNNGDNLQGKVTTAAIGATSVTLTDTKMYDMSKLNIPSEGKLRVGNHEYNYTSFTATQDAATGEYSIAFNFVEGESLIVGVTDEKASVGESVKYKGIPYYMAQMNEFVRTYAMEFNDIHKQGQDLNGDKGLDFFNGTDKVTGKNFTFTKKEDYYNLTAANFTVTKEILDDPTLIVTGKTITDGIADTTIVDSLLALKSDKNMFKQGTPASFLQTLVAEVGIDTKKSSTFSKSQGDILKMISNQRLSVSGVDIDEEAMNLVRFQNAYKLSAQVITTMNEIYNKLINEMGL